VNSGIHQEPDLKDVPSRQCASFMIVSNITATNRGVNLDATLVLS